MSGFAFPPPPPPPPKPSQPVYDQQGSQEGFHNRGRGRGRGRGNFRGDQAPRGRGQSSWRGNHLVNGGARPSNSERHHQNSLHSGSRPPHGVQPGESQNYHESIPPGSFLNPNFQPRSNSPTASNIAVNYIQSPANSYEYFNQQYGTSATPARTVAGHKRKLEALREPNQPRPKKPGPEPAPSVPSFGAPILHQSSSRPAKPSGTAAAANTKYKAKSLGLVPTTGDPEYSSSEGEEDGDAEVDEEAMYAELGDKLTFEHNGVMMALKSQADLAAWKMARRKNWPTKARMAEKDEERQRVGEERKRLLAGAATLQKPAKQRAPKSSRRLDSIGEGEVSVKLSVTGEGHESLQNSGADVKDENEIDRTRRQLAEQTNKLDELRKRVAESEARNRKAKAEMEYTIESQVDVEPATNGADAQLLTAAMDSATEIGEHLIATNDQEEISGSSDESTSEMSSETSSDSSSEADSDDGPPEEVASKPPEAAPTGPQRPVCRYFAASGYCRDGDYCQLKHERPPQLRFSRSKPQQHAADREQRPKAEGTAERKTIFQRLLEQEQNEEDRMALQVIKHLGKVGLFREVSPLQET